MTFTAPQIILCLGYTAAEAQLLTVPIYVGALISTIACARLADRYRTRWKFIVYPYLAAVVGFIGLLAVPQSRLPGLTYAFLFPVTMGCYPGVITVVSWVANNLAPSSKRACGMASTLMMANFGGAIGSNIFLASEAPHYWTGYSVSLGCLLLAIGCTIFLRSVYERKNRKRDEYTEVDIRAKYSEGMFRFKGVFRHHN
jgi:predicted MFS family arabinose efflux permease